MPAFGWTAPAPISTGRRPIWKALPARSGGWRRLAPARATSPTGIALPKVSQTAPIPPIPNIGAPSTAATSAWSSLRRSVLHWRWCRTRSGSRSAQRPRNVIAYLKHARQFDYADNNWKFFRIFVDIALDRVGAEFDRSLTKQYLEELEGFYIGDGWYRDGNVRRVDHYIPFAMHFYGLIYSKLVDDDYAKRYRERAVLFAKDFRNWFAPMVPRFRSVAA
jgi:hypothetical protein